MDLCPFNFAQLLINRIYLNTYVKHIDFTVIEYLAKCLLFLMPTLYPFLMAFQSTQNKKKAKEFSLFSLVLSQLENVGCIMVHLL